MSDEVVKGKNQDFLSLFKIEENNQYFDPVLFNKEFGFSIKRKYSQSVAKLLPNDEDPDYELIALFHVFVDKDEMNKIDDLKFIGVRVGMVIGKDKLIIPETKRIRRPVELLSNDDFSFDLRKRKFYEKGRPIEAIEILEKMYHLHIKPCQPFQGFLFRAKKFFLLSISKLLVLISQILVVAARLLFNDRYTWDHTTRAIENTFLKSSKDKDVIKVEAPKESFLGFPASRWSLFMYCFLNLLGYLLFKDVKLLSFMHGILSNPVLSVAYVFVTLSLYEKYLPLGFKWAITKLTVSAWRVKDRPLRI
jgi:hypothetical protein